SDALFSDALFSDALFSDALFSDALVASFDESWPRQILVNIGTKPMNETARNLAACAFIRLSLLNESVCVY
ncbi:MAG: hypothetical protein QGH33_15650, partial [Pirellulaceae bacterium]|nr:hypothetical protein [Pirellulaceae bacterium]